MKVFFRILVLLIIIGLIVYLPILYQRLLFNIFPETFSIYGIASLGQIWVQGFLLFLLTSLGLMVLGIIVWMLYTVSSLISKSTIEKVKFKIPDILKPKKKLNIMILN